MAKQVLQKDGLVGQQLNQKLEQTLTHELIGNILSLVPNEFTKCDFKIDAYSAGFYLIQEPRPFGTYDFITYIAQSITRSLGFTSSLAAIDPWRGIEFNAIPKKYHSERNNSSAYMRMSPIDTMLYAKSPLFELFTPIFEIWDKLEQQGIYNITDYNKPFDNNETTKSLGLIASKPVLRLDDWEMSLFMRADGRLFLPVVDQRIIEPEFILYPPLHNSLSLEQIIRDKNEGKIYGPKTLRIFEEIGYATINNPKMVEFALES